MNHPIVAVRAVLSVAVCLGLGGCLVGPDYQTPDAPPAASFKELAGWEISHPVDAADRGAWWSVYNDPLLDGLEREVDVSNQTLKESEAAYRNAKAIVDEARANLFPTLSGSAGATRGAAGRGSGGATTNNYALEASASWDLDVWGRIRRQVESDVALAQASAADIASARLSAQGSLATYYFDLRGEDSLQTLLDRTVAEYQRSLQITQNQYGAGVAARADVVAAQAVLQATQAQAIAVAELRQQYEHAIAVLTGHAPSDLTIPPGALPEAVPVVPPGIPSALLQRRPDVAAAERTMQAENALIGVAIAAFYPDISLSADFGYSGSPIGSLISVANRVWSLGASASETLFEGGARTAAVAAARASYDQYVASYRQTVLTAFQQVEDQLVALRVLEHEAAVQAEAVQSIRRAVAIALNEYRAGTVAYTTVITEQQMELTDEQTALSIQQSRLVASVSLIQALGGGWDVSALPDKASLQTNNPLLP